MTDAEPSPADPERRPAKRPSTDLTPSELRAADADRERVAEILRDAVAEGRLDMTEFEERLEATYAARTYGELEPITQDLPALGSAPAASLAKAARPGEVSVDWQHRIGGEPTSSLGVAVMSGFSRRGRWTAPRRFNAFALMGGGDIDLREANFADREIVVNCFAVMGGIDVIVPPGVEVVVRGISIMGGFDQPKDDGALHDPGAPRVIVTGLAFWGGVDVRRKLTKAERERVKAERERLKLERRAARRQLKNPPDTS
ncbi:DUF1707 SHOCT-like domain-containing protein [Streptomyces uncialis]|uniref:DUF1707 SHOCT-like domain-containing protein n=1 Tax=Streptomyces uncialis TaxID=1048205 RepID=UPI0009A0ABB3|nr:DUF1707 domain-containing protein [Streptomyces uncialis]